MLEFSAEHGLARDSYARTRGFEADSWEEVVRMSRDWLDTGWIEQGFLKRKSNYSPIVCFETSDPKRMLQLKEYVLRAPDGERFQEIFVFDQWEGLGKLVPSPRGPCFEPYKKRLTTSALAEKVSGQGLSLGHMRAALKEVDPILKTARCLFIIQNVSEPREWETGLQSALRAWATDPSVISKGSTVFIITPSAERILDDFTRELVVTISPDPSSEEERRNMISGVAKELGLTPDGQEIAELVVATAGLNLHQLESILLESFHRHRRFDLDAVKKLKSDLVRHSGVLEVRDPQFGFDDIGGYQSIKSFVRRYIINVLKQSERAKKFSLSLPRGMLFFGPPGTGKSLFANALAKEIRLPFINLVTENIYSKWLGESGQRMKNAIRLAEKMSPAIVFVDEIDRFGRREAFGIGGSAAEETRRVFSQFLEWLGDPLRQAIIVGTTNVPEHLDEAFTRTGRFDYKIPFFYPGERARLEVLLVHLGMAPGSTRPCVPTSPSGEEMVRFLEKEVVPRTRNFSCAELEELVTRAKRIAFDRGSDEVAERDFLEAAETFRIDERDRLRVIRNCLEQARRFTDDASFLQEIQEEMGLGVP